ncbi:uncharacterized protein LOC110374413 [Helicoverpa armigera]|uniref:uncharacterized protein LOC110374413 n=1 Tax=Helicoverpa armigera TaxID=29058 RepID=UPI000B3A273F|nr:uncharacterized protein LOC110374413 [Helicoverpa armigera]XP_047023631.1 uncharacterized protein LOC124632722 [Helicoverpa zea]PZC79854.1 hypothetical protein B5X24_HaOG215722 [Helicoverpa armigera]
MLCPEAYLVQNETVPKEEEETCRKKCKKIPGEGTGSLELNSYKNPKTWKKSISNFFRNQLRPTKSNDGDRPSGSKEQFEDKEISPEQKWQSLGKIFRRQSFDHYNKSSNQQGECSSPNKRLAVKKVLSSYFGKIKSSSATNDK